MRKMKGFVLVETLISLVIMSILGLAINEQIQTSIKVKSTIETASESLEDGVFILMRMKHDLLQTTSRGIRNESDVQESAFIGSKENVTFTKGGWANPLEVSRSTNQRVDWAFSNGQLTRSYFHSLDRADNTGKVSQTFQNVTRFQVQYMGYDLSWHPSWDSESKQSAPIAVKILIEVNASSPVEVLIELPSYDAKPTT